MVALLLLFYWPASLTRLEEPYFLLDCTRTAYLAPAAMDEMCCLVGGDMPFSSRPTAIELPVFSCWRRFCCSSFEVCGRLLPTSPYYLESLAASNLSCSSWSEARPLVIRCWLNFSISSPTFLGTSLRYSFCCFFSLSEGLYSPTFLLELNDNESSGAYASLVSLAVGSKL